MVATLPPEGGGVSTFTKSLTDSLDPFNARITILSQKCDHELMPNELSTKKTKIFPCWTSGFLYPFHIFKALCLYKPQIVHIQHEYFIFGKAFSAAMFPLLMVLTKFLDAKVIVTLHGIVNPAEVKDPELGSIGNENLKGMPRALANIGLLLITRLITDNSDKIIVMNNTHKNVLVKQYHCSAKKIALIPHGVPEGKPMAQDLAKKQLGLDDLKVVLYFGYITKYKGIDILIKAFKKIEDQNTVLIIGGSPHPRLRDDINYKKFWNSITEEISADKRIRLVGFIPDDLISTYISASDIVVFPYVASFSTGGPMNITLGYRKPIIASKVSSFSDDLPESAVFKTGSVCDLYRILLKALNDDHFNFELSQSTMDIANRRSWRQVAESTVELYFEILGKQKT